MRERLQVANMSNNDNDDTGSSTTFSQRLIHRMKTMIYAPPKRDADQAQIRVGLIDGDIPIFPPLASLFLTGCGLLFWYITGERYKFIQPDTLASSLPARVGIFFILTIIGIKIAKSCRQSLVEVATESNFQPVIKICDIGLYSKGRNFMYVAVLLIHFGLAVAFDTCWLLISMICMFLYLNYIVIPVEENMLRKQFGTTYVKYCDRVPRWFNVSSFFLTKGSNNNNNNKKTE